MKKRSLLLFLLLLIPLTVFAESAPGQTDISGMIAMEIVITIIEIPFVIIPLSRILSNGGNQKGIFCLILIGKFVLLWILYSIIEDTAVIIDFISIFVVPTIISMIEAITGAGEKERESISVIPIKPLTEAEKALKCQNCSAAIKETDKFCPICGKPVEPQKIKVLISRLPSTIKDYDSMYSLSEEKMIEEFVNRELKKEGLSSLRSFTTKELQKKRIIINTIMSLLIFTFISLIFFHFPKTTYVIGIIILMVVFILSRKVNILSIISKEIKARPNEKISNIVMSTKENLIKDYSKLLGILTMVIAIVLPLIIFYEPKILYEKCQTVMG